MMNRIALIYLAAGNSKRYGSDKPFSLFQGKELYRHGLEVLERVSNERNDCDVFVVTQPNRKLEIHCNATIIESKDSMKGMSYTLKCVCSHIDSNIYDYYLFMVADQPFIQVSSVNTFINHVIQVKPKVASFATSKRLGNPTMFHIDVIKDFDSLKDDEGGRKVFNKYKSEAYVYEISNEKELEDIDYPQKGNT